MNIKKEKEMFEEWYEKHHNGRQISCDYVYEDNSYSIGYANAMWISWQASANREAYKLLPVEMSWQKADEIASKEWDKNKTMFRNENRDMSTLQVEEFRLRWCRNKAHQIMIDYKAMMGACDE